MPDFLTPINKRKILKTHLINIKRLKESHKKKYLKLKRVHDISTSLFAGLSTITTSSIVLTFASVNPVFMIVGCVSSSIATIGVASVKAYQLSRKVDTAKTAIDNYSALEREINLVLSKKDLSESKIELIICDINNRLTMLEDITNPIYMSDSDSETELMTR